MRTIFGENIAVSKTSCYLNIYTCTCTCRLYMELASHKVFNPPPQFSMLGIQVSTCMFVCLGYGWVGYFTFLFLFTFLKLVCYAHVQYASKKTSHKRTVQRGARSRSAPVHAPFSSRSSPVRYNWLSRSCFCAVCPFFSLLNF